MLSKSASILLLYLGIVKLVDALPGNRGSWDGSNDANDWDGNDSDAGSWSTPAYGENSGYGQSSTVSPGWGYSSSTALSSSKNGALSSTAVVTSSKNAATTSSLAVSSSPAGIGSSAMSSQGGVFSSSSGDHAGSSCYPTTSVGTSTGSSTVIGYTTVTTDITSTYSCGTPSVVTSQVPYTSTSHSTYTTETQSTSYSTSVSWYASTSCYVADYPTTITKTNVQTVTVTETQPVVTTGVSASIYTTQDSEVCTTTQHIPGSASPYTRVSQYTSLFTSVGSTCGSSDMSSTPIRPVTVTSIQSVGPNTSLASPSTLSALSTKPGSSPLVTSSAAWGASSTAVPVLSSTKGYYEGYYS
ncbi:hypothetical protein AMS68_007885 [Peltaster fructicola]|uniref:REJ domain-containing protein n=1 Tax=Peltaster fructicola TaxID=286661 RepID=A0A6H0Y689_9PEZI|nr:hypothetical protein AMS68_007885 [Peltaster fructicola]